MKRSEINRALREMEAMAARHRFALPPFCAMTPQEWLGKGHEYDEIRDNMLGWDITDYGLGAFDKVGFSLITIRNGNPTRRDQYRKTYAEKLLYLKEGQYAPNHFHWVKMEDIINRGGGNLIIRLFGSLPNEDMDMTGDVTARIDGRTVTLPAGSTVTLTPGESITLVQGQYHSFWGQAGLGSVMVGEVSRVNDDHADNRFAVPMGRFPTVEEDAPRVHLLCTDYRTL